MKVIDYTNSTMRLRLKRTLFTVLAFGAITTFILHISMLVSEDTQEFDTGDKLQQVHRRAAGFAAASPRNGENQEGRADVAAVVDNQQNGGFLQLEKDSRGKLREMAWANDVPSLSEDESQVAPNASVTEIQLKIRPIEINLNQFALELQQTNKNLLDRVKEQQANSKTNQNRPASSINPDILQPGQNITIVVKDAAPKYIPVAAETAAKLQQPAPPIEGTNFRKTELNDIFIAVKTTGKYHKSRLGILLDTWVTTALEQTYFFTDVTDEEYSNRTNGHLINTNCVKNTHSRAALCCKTAVMYDTFLKSGKRWFCGVDDDNYLNVKQLLLTLQDYKHEQDVYLGRASLSHPIEASDRDNEMKRVSFWFATGGAGYCISRSLALKMSPYASGGTFKSVCNRIRLPDDVTLGFIIEILIKHPLTKLKKFNSHLQSLRAIKPDQLEKQITLSYGINEKRTNVIQLYKGAFSEKDDPTRFKSLHCLLNPSAIRCPNR